MVKTAIPTAEFTEIQKAFERNGKQYYYWNLLPVVQDDMTICLQTLDDHIPSEEEKEEVISKYTSICRSVLRNSIEEYDRSLTVNSFTLNGIKAWLDKATRVGLANSLAIEKAAGKTETTLFLDGVSITCLIDEAQQILAELELYALDCYRQTEAHKIAIESLSDPATLESYDYTQGYPNPPVFTITSISTIEL